MGRFSLPGFNRCSLDYQYVTTDRFIKVGVEKLLLDLLHRLSDG
jgi:hypothetical protein